MPHHVHPDWPSLPYELWERVLDLLGTGDLLSLHSSSAFGRAVANEYAGGGRLRGRSRVSSTHIITVRKRVAIKVHYER